MGGDRWIGFSVLSGFKDMLLIWLRQDSPYRYNAGRHRLLTGNGPGQTIRITDGMG